MRERNEKRGEGRSGEGAMMRTTEERKHLAGTVAVTTKTVGGVTDRDQGRQMRVTGPKIGTNEATVIGVPDTTIRIVLTLAHATDVRMPPTTKMNNGDGKGGSERTRIALATRIETDERRAIETVTRSARATSHASRGRRKMYVLAKRQLR